MSDPQTTLATRAAVTWALETFLGARPGWEHPSFNTLVGPLTAAQASRRPGPGRHSIWDLIRHMTHWRACTLARIRDQAMPDGADNWSAPPALNDQDDLEETWRAEIEHYRNITQQIIEAVRDLDPARPHPHADLAHLPLWMAVVGMQIHDSYHLGQISLLRRMQGLDPVE